MVIYENESVLAEGQQQQLMVNADAEQLHGNT